MDGDQLSALTASFRPTLAKGPRLVDIHGNVQSFPRQEPREGLVLNDNGQPEPRQDRRRRRFDHRRLPLQPRSDPQPRRTSPILSSSRIVAGRNGVSQVLKTPPGPLSLPD